MGGDVTELLQRARAGDRPALDELLNERTIFRDWRKARALPQNVLAQE